MNSAEVTISRQQGYILVERPKNYRVVLEEQLGQLQQLANVCNEADCKKVLVTGKGTRVDLNALDIYELGEVIARHHLQIALVEDHDAAEEDVSFLQNVSGNRGGPLRFFNAEEEAKKWLGVS